ncbi:MAG: hypothetical protein QGI63_01115 [Rhodospirillales bacterium]|jgi:hypothetical protein|nr:hypothetical protein [Rhodospirillales bacterium]MDP6772844.1 hypothetical protein [Rhodospirillales bacterium]|tara:strand:- start:255 stop:404 length:150 start_codon:yes stop_codon:yes gene_type:complete
MTNPYRDDKYEGPDFRYGTESNAFLVSEVALGSSPIKVLDVEPGQAIKF